MISNKFLLVLFILIISANAAAEDSWIRKTDMPTPRFSLAVSAVNGKLYAIGGMDLDGNNNLKSLSVVEEYDPKTDNWVRKQDMPTSRWFLGASAIDGKIYAIGGGTLGALYRTVEEYDPSTDKWNRKADMPTARDAFSTCVVNGIIYAIGGWAVGELSATNVEAYDPKTDTWTIKANMLTRRQGLATVVVDGKIYAIGGLSKGAVIADVNPGDILASVEEYDPVTDTWTEKSRMPEKRADLAACAINGRIYVFGGVDGSMAPTPTVYEYNPKTDEWIKMSDMQVPREALSADTVDGKIYAVGGYNVMMGIGILSTVEEYTPVNLSVSPNGKLSMSWGEIKREFQTLGGF